MRRVAVALTVAALLTILTPRPEGAPPVSTAAIHRTDRPAEEDAYLEHLNGEQATRVPPYVEQHEQTQLGDEPQHAEPAAGPVDVDPAVAARQTEGMVIDRVIGVLRLLRDGCGTSSKDQHDLRHILQTTEDMLRVLGIALDAEHLTLTAAAQRLADGGYLLGGAA